MATFDLASGTLRSPLANLPEEEEAEESLSPDWSPDGKALAYISKRHVGRGAECSIKIRSMHAGETREVRPQGHSFFYNLRWAPGGRSLLISAPEGLYRVDGQSGESSLLLKKIYGRFPQMQWEPSPDAKALYYSQRKSPNADTAFVELDLASGREREMIRRPTLGYANLSPDGRYIATASADPSDHARTFIVIPVSGGAPFDAIRVSGEPEEVARKRAAWLSLFAWAPDSRSVFIRKRVSEEGDGVELWQAFVDGSAPLKLDGKLDPRLVLGGFRLSADGRRLVRNPRAAPPEKAPASISFLPPKRPTRPGANGYLPGMRICRAAFGPAPYRLFSVRDSVEGDWPKHGHDPARNLLEAN
jgi:dipeptidyl aminopeptidase/acylaminoacyl peptidase